MRDKLLLIAAVLASALLSAHPGIGLVYDGYRYVYYTDLEHVWKLDTESGLSVIAVKDVHSHELFLDPSGNLFGEHYWYNASAQSFKNYIWKFTREEVFDIIRKEISGENTDFGFVRDSLFRNYSIEKNNGRFSIIRSDSMDIENLYSADLKNPGWKYLSHDGSLYFTDDQALFVLQENQLSKLASNLSSARFPFYLQGEEHSLYGIWQDEDRNTYLANYRGRLVQRINQNGEVTNVIRSGFFWSPVNGVFDKEQRLWLLESNIFGQVRLRKIEGTLTPISSPFALENLFIMLFGIILIAGLYDLINRRISRNKK